MEVKKYLVTRDYDRVKHNEIVYECLGYDYGLASDDTRSTGTEHISITLREDGGYPSFTFPKYLLKEIK